ncbi:MAG: PD-(D/E)XK nuclease family protein [Campylobacterota bacterium]|nr:PD-(D/E)XK nuclease family protein [Campylobacterota bacterium]
MSSHKETIILPSSRAIREQNFSLKSKNQLLPSFIAISEFMQRSTIVNNRVNIDEDNRVMLLLEAADFKNFSQLNIERNFFTFTSNSSYIFRFFEELSAEMVSIETLELADSYAEYEEHIEILTELHKRYKKVCDDNAVYDRIFLQESYILNEEYIRSLGKIILHVEGYLTNFELNILQECSQLIEVELIYEASQFNEKLSSKFLELGLELKIGYEYRIDFKRVQILSQGSVNRVFNVTTQSFGQRLLQVAYVKHRIYKYINAGIEPQKIVVVTPDENFTDMLRDFDDEGYFNFAKGDALNSSKFYRALKAYYDYLDNSTVENLSRINKLSLDSQLKSSFKRNISEISFEDLMTPFLNYEDNSRIKKIISEELYSFKNVLKQLSGATLKSALHLFLKRVASCSIDDVGGGKITVMGLLETRMASFDGVIIVDFNEGFVPRKSEKDLFLNSKVRERSNLPTLHDRESLQKLYYHNLISRAKEVSISYVEGVHSLPSRFLKEMDITTVTKTNDEEYSKILFEPKSLHVNPDKEIELTYDFKSEPLSASKLKIFLTCKRAFYYKYIVKLKGHEIKKDLPSEHEIGNILHTVLKEVYSLQNSYSDSDNLRSSIESVFQKKILDNVLHEYQLKLWLKRLEPFIENEIKRFSEGIKVLHCEKQFVKEYRGITLNGVIDRVDENGECREILDYKSGSYKLYSKNAIEKAVDFQLEFYYLLLGLGEKSVAFYDLKECKIVEENFLNEKLERLDEILKELSQTTYFSFEMTEDFSVCNYCDYIHLCKRG